jgi:hypothetical protein
MTRAKTACAWALLATTVAVRAQEFPPIEIIDLFGVRTLDERAVRDALPFREGDTITADAEDKDALERDVAAALGVAAVRLALVCCTANRGAILYVGVQEQPAPAVAYRRAPTGDLEVPAEVLAANDAFGAALMKAVTSGDAGEDRSQGHALANDPAMRAQQEVFIRFARDAPQLFADVLRESANAEHRAIATTVLGYAADKAWAARELEAAAFDADGGVRNNAVRALAIIGAYGQEHVEAGIEIDYTRFVELLNSLEQTDRNKGLFLLRLNGAEPDRRVIAALKERALPSLIEMCRWRNDGHAAPACFLLASVVGTPAPEEQALASREQLVAAGSALVATSARATP